MKCTLAAFVAGIALGGTGLALAAGSPVPVHMGYGVECYKVTAVKGVLCFAPGKHSNLGVGISNQAVTVIDRRNSNPLYVTKQR